MKIKEYLEVNKGRSEDLPFFMPVKQNIKLLNKLNDLFRMSDYKYTDRKRVVVKNNLFIISKEHKEILP